MAILDPSKRLKKELSLFDVYAISAGATLSSGFFLLPGIAAAEAGPAVVLTYFIAALPLLPGILSKIELATAMPRAGGVYYFLDRSMGPLVGTIGGLGAWLTLVLKVAFALVGMGAYLRLVWHEPPIVGLAIGLAILFGVLNVFGARRSGGLQVVMVIALLLCLLWFLAHGSGRIQRVHFDGFWDRGTDSILSTAGLVCISYIGLTKIASVSEEVRNPERNLPRATFLALGTALLVYGVGTMVMVGVLPPEVLYEGASPDLTPVATTAEVLVGPWGARVMTAAAVLAFFSVANAGILSASRFPLAMGRDHIMPAFFHRLGRFGTPTISIAVTVALVILCVLAFDPLNIAKLAGAFQLTLFAFNCLAVIVMRESHIESYDPGYRSPLYPWLHIAGILGPAALIGIMGWLPILFTGGLITIGAGWYFIYARGRVARHGAIYHVFERLGRRRFDDLDRELRGILKEKGLREQDPFVEIVARAQVIDAGHSTSFDDLVARVSRLLARRLDKDEEKLARGFREGTRTGATPVQGGAALPHLRLSGVEVPQMVMVRCRSGVVIETGDLLGEHRTSTTSFALFFLVSPDHDPGQHLRLLAELASRVDQDGFLEEWLAAADEHGLREILLRHERFVTVSLDRSGPSAGYVDREIRELVLPEGCLVAVVRRAGETVVPGGRTQLREGDQLTIIGSESAVRTLNEELASGGGSAAGS